MLIKVKVFPNSKKAGIIKKSEDSFEVKTKQKPLIGRANKEAIEILASHFNISESKIILVRGAKRRNKIFNIKK